ncbi:TonB-dependent receptor [Sphingomonas colocasiae]|uniref:TonB-dependent receptor n=1 Tax=Sphingomonas colocasiae TaxID=1848973 RepID=A0ABS7PJQ7_9SPHN|nr:TonB-dependent receptor [Sphingomonas colocasiae]MBY8821529.1 TonB-dependent receptor [Sphingomonas colocasiae]
MNGRKLRQLSLGLTVFAMHGAGLAAPDQAGNAAQEQAAAPDWADGGDIVVTAQKRAENIQDVAISIAAFSGQGLADRNVTDVTGLAKLVPNFTVTRGPQLASARLNIRGIGASGNTAVEPSVATFLDGIYVARPGALFGSMLDVEGVEVLRGPQGTLFGRNASVGAVALRSIEPENDFSGELRAEIGTGARYRLDGFVNLPVNDTLAFRAAAIGEKFDGLWFSDQHDRRFGGADTIAGRLSMKATPGAVTWLVRADYSRLKGSGFPLVGFLSDSVTPAGLATFKARLGGVLPDLDPFDRRSNQYLDDFVDDRQWGISSDLSLDFGDGFTARMLNGYRDWESRQEDGDLLFVPIPILRRDGVYDSKSQSHELQIISPKGRLMGGRLDFVAGLYYFHERYKIVERFAFLPSFCPTIVGLLAPNLVNACLAGPSTGATDLRFGQSVDSYAAYGQATYAFTDTLDLTLGARWTRDDKTGSFVQTSPNPVGIVLRAPETANLAFSGDRLTWRAQVGWKPADGKMLFASYSTGYKSGGFNSGGGSTVLGARRVFQPEFVKNYEIGAKTRWLDGGLIFNATLFRMDIAGFQDRSFDGVSFVVSNAGGLRQQGAELNAILSPDRNFQVDWSLAYLDSKFLEFKGASGLPAFGGTQDLTGAPATFSPKYSGSFGATYKNEIGNTGMRFMARANISFVSDMNIGQVTDNNPQTIQDGYALIGARLTLYGRDDRWNISLFGDNLTDKGYCVQTYYQVLDNAFGVRNPATGGTAVRCQVAAPRTLGASLGVRF